MPFVFSLVAIFLGQVSFVFSLVAIFLSQMTIFLSQMTFIMCQMTIFFSQMPFIMCQLTCFGCLLLGLLVFKEFFFKINQVKFLACSSHCCVQPS